MISCVLLFKSCPREVSGRTKPPPCGMDIRLAVGKHYKMVSFSPKCSSLLILPDPERSVQRLYLYSHVMRFFEMQDQ